MTTEDLNITGGQAGGAVATTRKSKASGYRGGASVGVVDLIKTFTRQDGTQIMPVDHASLEIDRGEMVVLLGPSGCGKTTLLRCIAGLETPDSGAIRIEDDWVYDSTKGVAVQPEHRRVSMVFQSYALWPHMTVFRNVAYPLRVRSQRRPMSEVRQRVRHVLDLMGIAELEQQYPGQLSGGQQQRVALARAIVPDTGVILFDEPLSNVDAKVRETLRFEIFRMQRELGFSGVYVTHDQEEAMEIADRIVVLEQGKMAQVGTPRDVYGRPSSQYVADFVGSLNRADAKVVQRNGTRLTVEVAAGQLQVELDDASAPWAEGDAVRLVWRPETTKVSTTEPQGDNVLQGTIDASIFSGAFTKESIQVGDVLLHSWSFGDPGRDQGERVWAQIAPSSFRVFPEGAALPDPEVEL